MSYGFANILSYFAGYGNWKFNQVLEYIPIFSASELLALAQIFNVSINEFFDGMEL